MNQMDDLMLPHTWHWVAEEDGNACVEYHHGFQMPKYAVDVWQPLYTTEQMHEYAKKGVEAEKAKRKPLTHEQKQIIEKANTSEGYHGDYYDAYGIMDDVEAFHNIITLD